MTTGVFARDLRLRLLREHLDRAADGSEDDGLCDFDTVVEAIESSAHALDEWHANGRRGLPAAGSAASTTVRRSSGRSTRLWAVPVYRAIYDPDGRSYRDRLKSEW